MQSLILVKNVFYYTFNNLDKILILNFIRFLSQNVEKYSQILILLNWNRNILFFVFIKIDREKILYFFIRSFHFSENMRICWARYQCVRYSELIFRFFFFAKRRVRKKRHTHHTPHTTHYTHTHTHSSVHLFSFVSPLHFSCIFNRSERVVYSARVSRVRDAV